MATIVPRKNDKGEIIGWQAKIRRRGFPVQSRTFESRKVAEDWGKVIEAEMIRGVHVDRTKAERTTLGQVIENYNQRVAPTHKGGEAEILRLNRFIREEPALCAYSLANLKTAHFEDFMQRRLDEVSPGTVKRELGLLHSVIEAVRKAYGMVENPISDVRRPQVNDARDVRLHPGDEDRLLAAIQTSRNPWLRPAVILAVETAMRRSELLALRWNDIDFDQLKAHVRESKTDDKRRDRQQGREVPLSPRAYDLLWELGSSDRTEGGRVLGTTAEGLKQAFERARTRANMEHLNFHDLRHEATSRLVERGWGILEIAAVTGHADLQMLKRYTNLRAHDLARKLDQ